MKILQLIHGIDPQAGGPSYVISKEVRELCCAGHEVTVLSTDVQYGRATLPREEYVRSIHKNPDFAAAEVFLGHAYGRRRPFSNFAYSPECARWLRDRLSDPRKAPDVVHINATYSHVATSAAAHARRFSIPYILRPFGNLDTRSLRAGCRFAKQVFGRALLRKDLDRAARVLACSDAEAEELEHWVPRERLAVVSHGVEIPTSDPAAAARRFLEAFPQCRGRRVILFLGRIDAVKRPEIIVAAISRLRGEFPDLILLAAGQDGGHLKVFESVVAGEGMKDSVVHAGFLDGELKEGAFAVASLLAHPSSHENFGIVVAEAMVHGLPVLVTPEVASHVHVDQSGAGLTVPGDPESFARGIAQLLSADHRETMGRKGKEYVEANLTWTQVGRRLVALYEDVIARHGRNR
jgi:glycosyltransferase involved in cell wall biosynthesis